MTISSHDTVLASCPPGTGIARDVERVADDGALTVQSKRTERLRRKYQRKLMRSPLIPRGIFDFPYELVIDILSRLYPSDIMRLSRTSKAARGFILQEQRTLATNIIRWRYACLANCLRLPVLLEDVDATIRPLLQTDERQAILAIHKKPYQHVEPPDPALICTCLTCILRWNSLCLVVDFAHWQRHLEKGQPIPMIPRGKAPEWNQALVARNAAIVTKAMHQPLYYAAILEAHLKSTTMSIRRHSENKGNKRRRFRMTAEDEKSGTDVFLERSGPPTLDFPFHRDNYYMLEAYLPNRGWNGEEDRWMYMPVNQHDRDIQFLKASAERRMAALSAKPADKPHQLQSPLFEGSSSAVSTPQPRSTEK